MSETGPRERSLLGRIGRNAGFLVSAKGAGAVFGLLYLSLAARALGAADLGIVLLTHSVVVTIREIASFRSWQVLINYGATYLKADDLPRFRHLLRLTSALDVVGAVVGAAAGVVAILLFASALGIEAEYQRMALIYCVTSLIALRWTPIGLLRTFDRFDILARQALVVPVMRTIGVAVGWYFDWPLLYFIGVWLVSDATASLVLIALGWRELNRRMPRLDFMGGERRKDHEGIWPFIVWANLQSTVAAIALNAPVILSGGLISTSAAAYVKVSQELANVLAKPAQLLGDVIYPEAVRIRADGDVARLRAMLFRLTGTAAAIIGAVVLLGSLGAEQILGGLFGEEYREAAAVLTMFLIAGGVLALGLCCESTLFALNHPRAVFLCRAAATVILVVGIAAMAGQRGAEGVGLAMLAYAISASVLLWSSALRALKQQEAAQAA
ncbi:MAG: lipopolysaccharide biosynthesis protein [Pseudomonadota bacterium]